MARPIIEPFRIKVVEPIRMTTQSERQRILATARYNLFGVHADDVVIDLLTDSGTGAMSAAQWGAMMVGDESYAGCRSFFRLEQVVHQLTGMPHVFPTHQGRAAERILSSVLPLKGKLVLSNGLFDTTRANIENAGATGIDLCAGATAAPDATFKGDIDLKAFDQYLETRRGEIALVVMTATNNASGGHAVSLQNLREVSRRCKAAGIMLFLDACRFAENAYRIKADEPTEKQRRLVDIAREMFDLVDGFTMSAKKDAIVNIGGLLGFRDHSLAEQARVQLILTEGFTTYGGLAGRDLEAMAQGLEEVLDERYLEYRFAASDYLARALEKSGWPVLKPSAAHAVYVDAGAALPHLESSDLPGQSLACALYLAGGIRCCEIGDLMFGSQLPHKQLIRLALPRRVYTQSHVDYVAAVFGELAAVKSKLPAMRVVEEAPVLRHFTAALVPVAPFPEVEGA